MWFKAMCKELGRLSQEYGEKGSDCHTEGTDTMRDHEGIGKIPCGRIVTLARIVVDYRAHKKDPTHVRITAGENVLKYYPGELTTRTSDLTASKWMWNSISVISTPGVQGPIRLYRRKYFLPCNPVGIFPVHENSYRPYTPGIH